MRIMRFCVTSWMWLRVHLFNDLEIVGDNRLPKKGGYVICSNHVHWMDPILYVSLTHRMIYAIAKEELFNTKLKAFVMRRLGLIKVERDGKDSNKEAIGEAVEKLKKGKMVIIYPEGTRFGLKNGVKPKKGVAMIALQARVPIIPMAVVGSFKKHTKIRVTYGDPIDISEYYPKEGENINLRSLVTITNKVMDKIVELRDSINTEEIENEMNEAEEERKKRKEQKQLKEKSSSEE